LKLNKSSRRPRSQAVEVAQAPQSAPTSKQQGLEHEQQWDRAEALARALTSSLRTELDAVRSAAEAARIKQKQALEQERGRADALAGGLASLQAVLETARVAGLEAAQATEAEIKERQALEQERGRADALGREVISLRAELDAARTASPKVAQAAAAAVEQKQTLEKDLKQEHDKAERLARELASVRNGPEAGNWQIVALNTFRALHLREPPIASWSVRAQRRHCAPPAPGSPGTRLALGAGCRRIDSLRGMRGR
jgi:chromosome segregation ATPase